MWNLRTSKELLEQFKYLSFLNKYSIKILDLYTLNTTITHGKLKTCLKEVIHNDLLHRNGTLRHTCIALEYQSAYLSYLAANKNNLHTEEQVISMLVSLIDNIFVHLWGKIFKKVFGILRDTHLLVDLFLFRFQFLMFLSTLVKKKEDHKQLDPLISHTGIMMMCFPLTIHFFQINSINISSYTKD